MKINLWLGFVAGVLLGALAAIFEFPVLISFFLTFVVVTFATRLLGVSDEG